MSTLFVARHQSPVVGELSVLGKDIAFWFFISLSIKKKKGMTIIF